MDKKDYFSEEYHYLLISSYLYKKALYSFPFKERVLVDLGDTNFQVRNHDKTLDALSNEDLEDKLDSLKAPWWNEMYKKVSENKKFLLIFKILFIQRDFSIRSMKLIYKILKSKET